MPGLRPCMLPDASDMHSSELDAAGRAIVALGALGSAVSWSIRRLLLRPELELQQHSQADEQ